MLPGGPSPPVNRRRGALGRRLAWQRYRAARSFSNWRINLARHPDESARRIDLTNRRGLANTGRWAVPCRGMTDTIRRLRLGLRPGGIGSDTVWALGVESLTLAVGVLSFALLGSGLGAAGYGDYVAIFAVTGTIGTVATSGTGLALMHHLLRQHEETATVVRSMLTFGTAAGVALSLVAVPVVLLLVRSVSTATAVAFVCAEIVAAPMIWVATDLVRVRIGFGTAARMKMLLPLSRAFLLVFLSAIGLLRLDVLGPAMLVLTLVVGIVLVTSASRTVGLAIGPGRVVRAHATSASLYAVGLSALAFQNDGDKAVMSASVPPAEAGRYAAAYKIVQFGLLPMGSLLASSHQRFLQHDVGDAGQHLRRTLRYSTVAIAYGVTFALAIAATAPLLTHLLGDEYANAESTIRLLAPLVLARSVSLFALNGLLGLGRTIVRTSLLVAGAAVALLLYLTLIPRFGTVGAVAATLISETAVALAAWTLLVKFQRREDRRS